MNLCTENKPKKGLILRIKLGDFLFGNADFKRSFLSKVLFTILFTAVFLLILIQLRSLFINSRQLVKTPKNHTRLNKEDQRLRPDYLIQTTTDKLFITKNEKSLKRSRRAISLLNGSPKATTAYRFRFADRKGQPTLALRNYNHLYGRKKKSLIMFNKLVDTIKKLVENKPIKSGMTKHSKAGDHSGELSKEQSISQFTTPSFVRQFIDKGENKQHLVKWYHRHPGTQMNDLQMFNSSDDQQSRIVQDAKTQEHHLISLQPDELKSSEPKNEILARQLEHLEPKYNGYHSNPRMMPYSENTYKPTFDSREKELAYRSRIYWRCYFNAISCF